MRGGRIWALRRIRLRLIIATVFVTCWAGVFACPATAKDEFSEIKLTKEEIAQDYLNVAFGKKKRVEFWKDFRFFWLPYTPGFDQGLVELQAG